MLQTMLREGACQAVQGSNLGSHPDPPLSNHNTDPDPDPDPYPYR